MSKINEFKKIQNGTKAIIVKSDTKERIGLKGKIYEHRPADIGFGFKIETMLFKADKKYSEIYSKDFYIGRDNIELIEEA